MSDTRDQAQHDLVAAGIEDSLGAALSSSFTLPPTEPKPKPASTSTDSAPTPVSDSAPTEPAGPEVEDWKPSYEANLAHWRAEADVAREKAAATRKRYEDEAASSARAESDKASAAKRAAEAARKETEQAERLKRLLEEGAEASGRRGVGSSRAKEEREKKVKEAWELVKGAGEQEAVEHVTDARGVMEADKGVATVSGQSKGAVAQTAYDPTTSTEPVPPALQDVTPSPELPLPSESATLSRHSATSQAWEEISGDLSSGEDLSPPRTGSSGDDLPTADAGRSVPGTRGLTQSDASYAKLPSTQPAPAPASGSGPAVIHPAATGGIVAATAATAAAATGYEPPSLTLSLFTAPSHLTFPRVLAVLGINLVLPFINGVMYGFGEIFARETVGVARLWWRGERALFGWWRGGARSSTDFGAGRGVAGVGLSGSGSFP